MASMTTNVLGTAARLAKQVVTGFTGGLIEGIGEGFGHDIVLDVISGTGSAFVGTRT